MVVGSDGQLAAHLASHHVMTLATLGPEGPWAAAVFYAQDAAGGLLFLSSPTSRHARNLAADPRCAATIQDDFQDWHLIQGVQLEGVVERLHGEALEAAHACYARRYRVAADEAAPPAVRAALAKVAWYRLQPARYVWIDNLQGFGHREEIAPA